MNLGRILVVLAAISLLPGCENSALAQPSVNESLPPPPTPPLQPGYLPLIDAHNHIVPGMSVDAIVSFMDAAGIQKTVLTTNTVFAWRPMGQEEDFVLEAYRKYPQRIIPFLSTVRGGWLVPESAFVEYAEKQLKTGIFKGMGEFLLRHYPIAGGPKVTAPEVNIRADSPYMEKMMRLGEKYKVPLLIHMETTPDTVAALERALQANPNTKLIWAHQNPVKMGGGPFSPRGGDPNQIATLLDKYPNLYADIAIGYESLFLRLQEDRRLPEDWKKLYEKYNDRFVIGSDLPSYHAWTWGLFRANYMRTWLSQLSPDTARKLAYENIERILSAKP